MKPFEASIDSSHPHTREQKHNGAVSVKVRGTIAVFLSLFLFLVAVLACEINTPPNGQLFPECTPTPCPHCAPSPAPTPTPDYGPTTQRSGKYSIEIDITPLYLEKLVLETWPAPQIDSCNSILFGIDPDLSLSDKLIMRLRWLRLSELGSGPNRINLMAIVINPYIATPSDPTNHTYVSNITYTLWLRFTPHLITPETIPDQGKRQVLLCNPKAPTCKDDNGIVLELGFYALTRGDTGKPDEPLNCESGGCDSFVEPALLKKVKEFRSSFPIPANDILDTVASLVHKKPTITGMDLGTDQYLKIGFVVDQGVSTYYADTFDSTYSELSRYDDAHWGALIDTNLIAFGIEAAIVEQIRATNGGKFSEFSGFQTFRADFTALGVLVYGTGVLPVCGDVPFSLWLRMNMGICTLDNSSRLHACTRQFVDLKPVDPAQTICIGVYNFLVPPYFGTIGSNCPDEWQCSVISKIEFEVKGDRFYATEIDATRNKFFVAGHIASMDKGSPPALPACGLCPP